MTNQLKHLLSQWFEQRDQTEWVLGTVYQTHGPCYRKAGAMMLFNGQGAQYGLLSGGCLESDIQQHAKRVMQRQQSMLLRYDASDEDDLSFQLGIGCGGVVDIVLQPITAQNDYLELDRVYQALLNREVADYHQLIHPQGLVAAQLFAAVPIQQSAPNIAQTNTQHSRLVAADEYGEPAQWLINRVQPEPHLLVVGGGVDARPLINLASELGWETSLWDERVANARPEYFMAANHIVQCDCEALADYVSQQRVSAAVLMSHNIKLDAHALQVLHHSSLDYLALLGPASRRDKVLQAAGLTESDLQVPLSGPAGLDIGGELPESIALSILAECHACLMGKG